MFTRRRRVHQTWQCGVTGQLHIYEQHATALPAAAMFRMQQSPSVMAGRKGHANVTYEDEDATDRGGIDLLRCGVHHGDRCSVKCPSRQMCNLLWRIPQWPRVRAMFRL